MRKLLRRIAHWLNSRQANADLDEEIESHRAMKQEELERSGITAKNAAAESKRARGTIPPAFRRS